MTSTKPIHTLVLDTGSVIKNDPPVSTLLNQSEGLVTTPAVIAEIKDAVTRARVQTTLQPFLTLRSPSPSSIKFVSDFARRTGDLAVLSTQDIEIIALTYEIECERNGGDWRLRRMPGQKRVNGAPPTKSDSVDAQDATQANEETSQASEEPVSTACADATKDAAIQSAEHAPAVQDPSPSDVHPRTDSPPAPEPIVEYAENDEESESDSDGWITPSNLKKKQAEDAGASLTQTPEPATMQVAVLTTDFAMQNVILQINLNLISSSMIRVRQLKTFVLRCHACFQVTKDMAKQFCPKCGQPNLTRVSCSTNANGEFKLHLKKNMQWNHRGDRYSIPKPVHGSSNGKMKGGGKGGWGNELIFAEDQKEYQRQTAEAKRHKERSLMDEDYLPSILTGDRGRAGGRIKVGAGRNVNAKKR